jgi:hypothetical protein
VTLPEVVTGELAGKFGEILLFDQHTDFELGSASNSNSTSPWAIACEPATQPSHVVSPPHELSTHGPRNLSRARTEAPSSRRAGKEPVPEYNSDSDTTPGRASDSNPLSGFYSDSAYEFDFGLDLEDPKSEDNTTEQPLSGPASGLVITSTLAGRFVYWPDRKPADLMRGDSRYVAYLDSLPFQEGTPLTRTEEYSPTEEASSDSSLGNLDRQVFMAAGDTPGTSGAHDRYLEDISADELSAEAPVDETDANRDARRERNRRRNERRRCLRDNLPIRNLVEALEVVESKVHTTPEQCLMSITAIARQAQGIRAGEFIAKLAEDAYFMGVDNRVTQPPPPGTATTKLQVAAQTPAVTVLEPSCRLIPTTLVQTLADPLKLATALRPLTATARSSLTATLTEAVVMAEAPTMEPTGRPEAEAVAAVETTQTATPPEPRKVATTPARRLKSCGGRSPPPQATTTTSPPSLLGFTTYFSRTSSSLWESPSTTRSRTPFSGSGATPSPSRMLAATTTPSASTSPSAWTWLRSLGSSR